MSPVMEKEGPVASTTSNPAPEQPRDNSKGTQKRHRGARSNQGKAHWHRPYPKGLRIPKLEPSAMESLLNMARTLMEFTAKEQERMTRNYPCK
ncbi:hypothetical protein O181_060920 [Austropuccinia psidii MF-1]|uniref:Uncharacterized protein n=1 Tax=Austropuccinia psidii MF-1 TaxID=1389203 RepID=A0A9Q3EE75_9BASI|nr:hypothetical protein [Austropuccinia psidii MF-1]